MNDTFIIAWRSKAQRSLPLDDKPEAGEDNHTNSEIDFPLVTDEEEQEAVLI